MLIFKKARGLVTKICFQLGYVDYGAQTIAFTGSDTNRSP